MNKISLHRVILSSLLGLAIVSACNRNLTYVPGVDIPIEKMNYQLKIDVPAEANTFEQGKAIGLVVTNKTQTTIFIDENTDIKLYYRASEDWLPLENDLQYPERKKYVPTGNNSPGGLFLFAIPKIFEDKPVIVRIVVVGHQDDPNHGTDTGLAAFTDFELRPLNE